MRKVIEWDFFVNHLNSFHWILSLPIKNMWQAYISSFTGCSNPNTLDWTNCEAANKATVKSDKK